MATVSKLTPLILKWEGGYVDDPLDRGRCTNMGVTIATYRNLIKSNATCKDVAAMNQNDFEKVLRIFWNRWKANDIKNQSVANILVDWVWGSGVWGIRIPQRILGVKEDGVVGIKTLTALNNVDQLEFFNKVVEERKAFLHNIVIRDPEQRRFINGWLNRLNDFNYYE